MEKALEIFINKWKSVEYVQGILLSGSYAVGLQNKNSDIDIRLIFHPNYQENIKGLDIINGFKFSYLGRPAENTEITFSTEFFGKNKFEARIFSIGKIIYGPTEKLQLLIDKAKIYLQTPFINKAPDVEDINTNMYSLYSSKIYLDSLSESSSFFLYHYYNFLRQAIKFYAKFLNYEFFLDSKTEAILTDEIYRKTYYWETFPDREFILIWTKAIKQDFISKQSITEVYHYLEEKIVKVDEEKFTITWEG